jgi:hypothetical protein
MATALPDSDSYREYKADTSIFLSGIADAAKACGHVPKLTLVTVNKDKAGALEGQGTFCDSGSFRESPHL